MFLNKKCVWKKFFISQKYSRFGFMVSGGKRSRNVLVFWCFWREWKQKALSSPKRPLCSFLVLRSWEFIQKRILDAVKYFHSLWALSGVPIMPLTACLVYRRPLIFILLSFSLIFFNFEFSSCLWLGSGQFDGRIPYDWLQKLGFLKRFDLKTTSLVNLILHDYWRNRFLLDKIGTSEILS